VRALIVEDEEDLAELVKEMLQEKHFTVDLAADGEEGMYYALNQEYDILLLDVMLPVQDGWALLKKIRQQGIWTPVIMLTALAEVRDRVQGLKMGADDYVPKPFHMDELFARVESVIRRTHITGQKQNIIRFGSLTLDLFRRVFQLEDRTLELTKKEYQILEYLMLHPDEVIPREKLEEHLWAEGEEFWTDVLRTHIKNIRKKLGKDGKKMLQTVRGVGYAFKTQH